MFESHDLQPVVALARHIGVPRGYAACERELVTPELPKRQGPASAALGLVRELFHNWGLDKSNMGTARWNPLGALVPAGSKVAIKPNWVYHAPRGPGSMDSLVTHTSVIQAVLEYLALTHPAAITIGDAPLQGCDFEALGIAAGLESILLWASQNDVPVEIADFRRTVNPSGHAAGRRREDARPLARFVPYDLGDESSLMPLDADAGKFRVTAYDPDLLAATHQPGRHRYLIAREVLEADVVVNLPKLKCHMKACITGALKNLVGINGHKEYLPHHRKGGSGSGGDCYPGAPLWKDWMEAALDTANRAGEGRHLRLGLGRILAACRKFAAFAGADDNLEGAWYGNDTVWRMCLDLNRILKYGDVDGRLSPTPQRAVIHITDAIVAGEGEGPLRASPVESEFLTGALNAAAADYVHARLMGFDPDRIPIVREAFENRTWPLAGFRPDEILVRTAASELRGSEVSPVRFFVPPRGWRGHCELPTKDVPVETHLASV
jgi:uncharacterized protein (DUF362 family)